MMSLTFEINHDFWAEHLNFFKIISNQADNLFFNLSASFDSNSEMNISYFTML